ncbi:MAG: glycosyltransferase family 2 protein [Fimbriimonadaceae bacterium]
MARVTVGMAVFNGAETIAESLDSVVGQSFQDFEVLVVDDGSTDDSGAMARSRGCRVISQTNQGLGAARRRLVEEAAGDFVAFVDADDTWTLDKLERQVAVIEHTGSALVHSDCWYLHKDGHAVERNLDLPANVDALDHLVPNNLVVASSALFDRRRMLEAGNFSSDTVRCSDWYGWFLLASQNSFVHLPEKQVRYKVLPTSLANAGFSFHDAQRYVLEEKVLPRFDELFARLDEHRRASYRRKLLRALGVSYSAMGKALLKQGKVHEAREMGRKAIRLAPGVARVWTRALKGYLP